MFAEPFLSSWRGLPPSRGGCRRMLPTRLHPAPLLSPPPSPLPHCPRPNRALLFLSLQPRPSISNSVIKVLFLPFFSFFFFLLLLLGLGFFLGEKVVSFMLSCLSRLAGRQLHEGRAVPNQRKTKSRPFRPYAVFPAARLETSLGNKKSHRRAAAEPGKCRRAEKDNLFFLLNRSPAEQRLLVLSALGELKR